MNRFFDSAGLILALPVVLNLILNGDDMPARLTGNDHVEEWFYLRDGLNQFDFQTFSNPKTFLTPDATQLYTVETYFTDPTFPGSPNTRLDGKEMLALDLIWGYANANRGTLTDIVSIINYDTTVDGLSLELHEMALPNIGGESNTAFIPPADVNITQIDRGGSVSENSVLKLTFDGDHLIQAGDFVGFAGTYNQLTIYTAYPGASVWGWRVQSVPSSTEIVIAGYEFDLTGQTLPINVPVPEPIDLYRKRLAQIALPDSNGQPSNFLWVLDAPVQADSLSIVSPGTDHTNTQMTVGRIFAGESFNPSISADDSKDMSEEFRFIPYNESIVHKVKSGARRSDDRNTRYLCDVRYPSLSVAEILRLRAIIHNRARRRDVIFVAFDDETDIDVRNQYSIYGRILESNGENFVSGVSGRFEAGILQIEGELYHEPKFGTVVAGS